MKTFKSRLKMLLLIGLTATVLSGCASIKDYMEASSSGADKHYSKAQYAWGDKDYAEVIYQLGLCLKKFPEYGAAQKYLIQKYDTAITKAEANLAELQEDDFDSLFIKYEKSHKLASFYALVEKGSIPSSYTHKKAGNLTIELKDFQTLETTLAEKGRTVGFDTCVAYLGDKKLSDAEGVIIKTVENFYSEEEIPAAKVSAANLFYDNAATYTKVSTVKELETGYKVLGLGDSFAESEETKTRGAEVKASLNKREAGIYLGEIKGLKKKGDEKSLLAGLQLYDKVIGLQPEKADTYTAQKSSLSKTLATYYYKKAVSHKKKGGRESLLTAWKFYEATIKYMPEGDKARYEKEKDSLYISISDSYNYSVRKAEKGFKKTPETYEAVITAYDELNKWNDGYKDSAARLAAWKKENTFKIFVFSDYSPTRPGSVSLANALRKDLKKSVFFDVVDPEALEGSEAGIYVALDYDNTPLMDLEISGYRYYVLAETSRRDFSKAVKKKSSSSVESDRTNFARVHGSIVTGQDPMIFYGEGSDTADGTVTDAMAAIKLIQGAEKLTGGDGSKTAEIKAKNGIDDMWFGVKYTKNYTETWLEGKVATTVSVYDTVTGKRLFSKKYYRAFNTPAQKFLSSITCKNSDVKSHLEAENKVTSPVYPEIDSREWTKMNEAELVKLLAQEDLIKGVDAALRK